MEESYDRLYAGLRDYIEAEPDGELRRLAIQIAGNALMLYPEHHLVAPRLRHLIETSDDMRACEILTNTLKEFHSFSYEEYVKETNQMAKDRCKRTERATILNALLS